MTCCFLLFGADNQCVYISKEYFFEQLDKKQEILSSPAQTLIWGNASSKPKIDLMSQTIINSGISELLPLSIENDEQSEGDTMNEYHEHNYFEGNNKVSDQSTIGISIIYNNLFWPQFHFILSRRKDFTNNRNTNGGKNQTAAL